MGYESAAVTQKTYNGVAVLSRLPIETINTTLAGDDRDSHARFLETKIAGVRIVNVYMPNGNPIGSDKFIYKLSWMDRMMDQMIRWLREETPTIIGGDFNVIPEDIDCHKPESWMRDALFQPEPRAPLSRHAGARLARCVPLPASRPARRVHFLGLFSQCFRTQPGIRIDHFLLSPPAAARLLSCEIDKGPRTQEKPSDHTPILLELR